MLGLLLPALIATGVAALWVRSLAGLQRAQVQWWQLALGAIAVQLVLYNPPVDQQPWAVTWGPFVWVATLVALVAVLCRNGLSAGPGRYALVLAAAGVGANLVVVLANGGYMPQSPEARMSARGGPLVTSEGRPQLRNVVPSGPDTRLGSFGDIIAQPSWLPTANVVSVGDLMLSAGLAWWVFRVITSARLPQVRRQTADSQ
jgi:Family of unknown function (DUF5317)